MQPLLFGPTAAQLLSVASCIRLLLTFRKFDGLAWRRLFLRQLWFLALSDILGTFGLIGLSLVRYGNVELSDPGCKVLCPAFWVFRFWSVLLETHIAAGVLSEWRRWIWQIRVLHRTLLWLPALALIFTILAYFTSTPRYGGPGERGDDDVKTRQCFTTREFWSFGVLLVCLVSSSAFYLSALFRACRSPRGVRCKVVQRALAYLLSFAITYGPTFVLMWIPLEVLNPKNGFMFYFANCCDTCEGLNGFLNAAAYFSQTRYARTLLSRDPRRRPNLNEQPQGNPAAPVQVSQMASFHACFDPMAVSEIDPFSLHSSEELMPSVEELMATTHSSDAPEAT